MTTPIFARLAENHIEALEPAPFASEADLRDLIFRQPDLLVWNEPDSSERIRWLPVTREKGIERPGAGHGWWIDILFLDQRGIPTLVEAKLGSNRESRRAVVGQMLDYVSADWTSENLRHEFEIDGACSSAESDDFWMAAHENLRNKRFRLLFVSDDIPQSLENIVTFLNDQLRTVTVGAVEIKRYRSGSIEAYVPRVIGSDRGAALSSGLERMTPDGLLQSFTDDESRAAASLIIDAAGRHGVLRPYKDSLSIVAERPPPEKPVVVGWLYPQSRDPNHGFVFGVPWMQDDSDDEDEQGDIFEEWVVWLAALDGAVRVRNWLKSTAWSMPHSDLPSKAQIIADRLSQLLVDLRRSDDTGVSS